MTPAALMFQSDWHDRVWNRLLYSIHTGKPAFDNAFGVPAFEWFESHPEAAEQFQDANGRKAAATHSRVAEAFPFNTVRSVVDIGGGDGSLLMAILDRHPHLTGTVLEREDIANRTRHRIADSGLAQRLRVEGGDLFAAVPDGGDLYLLSHVLHDWPDDACIGLLSNCRKAMRPHARLVILEAVIQPGNTFDIAKWLDLEVLLMGGGRERREDEFRRMAAQAGLCLKTVTPLDAGLSMLVCCPA